MLFIFFQIWNQRYIFMNLLLCSGLNFLDLMVRQGTIDNPPKPPVVPGFECSGIVEAVGENSEGFEVKETSARRTVMNDTCHIFLPAALTIFCPDRGQSHGFCELQRLGRSCLHAGRVCLQNAGWNDVCRGRRILHELCGCLYDALWGSQPARGDVSVGALGWRWRRE